MGLRRLSYLGSGFVWEPVVLPVASLENHGVLPLGSDLLIAECVVGRLRSGVTAPAVAYTTSAEHVPVGYTVSIPASVFTEYLGHVLEGLLGLAASVVVAVFHGGAVASAQLAARAARARRAGRIALYDFWAEASRILGAHGFQGVVHGGPVEASVLAACGHSGGWLGEERSVEEVLEVQERLSRGLAAGQPWLASDNPSTYTPAPWGWPYSRRLGEEIVEGAVEALEKTVEELSRGWARSSSPS